MTLPGHDAPGRHYRGRTETVFLRAEQRRHYDISSGLEPSVRLKPHAVAQPAHYQYLLSLRQSELPWSAGMLDGSSRRCSGPAVMPADQNHVGECLGNAGGDRADAHLGDQLDIDLGSWIDALQVIDQLRQIFDTVDVMMRRGRDEGDARRRMTEARDVRGNFVSRATALPLPASIPEPF